jgi:hypothetical protein
LKWFNFFEKNIQRKHPFGRGINANISPDEEELFNRSYEAFEDKKILEAYQYFFDSLENFTEDIPNQNILTSQEDEKLTFTIFQGSAVIHGYVTSQHLYAEATITKKHFANVSLKRYILERNYQFTYASYFSDEEFIKLKIYHDNITMSPQKIFFPLREIALNADFDKEYIRSEFPDLSIEEIEHLKELDPEELEIKYKFMQEWIQELEHRILTFPSNDNSGMQAFACLNLLLKTDYLLVPKYDIYQKLSKKVQEYFSEENSSIESKNEEVKEYIAELKELDFETFCKMFYNAKYTFNPTEKTSQEEIGIFITESLAKIRWYKSNRYNQIIPTIYKYIAFYILYNYGVHPVIRALLHMLVEIQNPKFFKALGYTELYNEENNSFAQRQIITRIADIITPYQAQFKALKVFGDTLDFSSLNDFSNSFYIQVKNLDFEEV